MKILCIGDSLGMPRPGVSYEETWFYRLSKAFPQHVFVSEFRRAMLINEAVSLFDSYYTFYKPDIIIIQTGICDCSPRTFNTNSTIGRRILKLCSILGVSNIFWAFIKQRERKTYRVYTKLKDFRLLYETLINKLFGGGVKKIIVVKIGHGASSLLVKSKAFNDNVDLYNKTIEEVCRHYRGQILVSNPLNDVTDDIFVDGYHCNSKGMDLVYRSLEPLIRNLE